MTIHGWAELTFFKGHLSIETQNEIPKNVVEKIFIYVTGGQPLKLAHSLLGYAVGMTDINRPGWPITRKQTHRNKF